MRKRTVGSRIWAAIKFVIATVIAVALAKIAFFSGGTDPNGDASTPTGQLFQDTVSLQPSSISSSLELQASIRQTAPQTAVSAVEGTVSFLPVSNGSVVAQGDLIVEVRREVAGEPIIDDEGNPVAPEPTVTYQRITAPTSGTLSGLDLIIGQSVTLGATVASVQPSTFVINATMDPIDQYRIVTPPSTATVTIQDGPPAFECTGLSIGGVVTPPAGQAPETPEVGSPEVGSPVPVEVPGGQGTPQDGTRTAVTCAVPEGVRVFPGLTGSLQVSLGQADNVQTLPATAVSGRVGQGLVYVLLPDGSTEERSVELGLNDGQVIEIRSGLEPDEQVLAFVPLQDDMSSIGSSGSTGL